MKFVPPLKSRETLAHDPFKTPIVKDRNSSRDTVYIPDEKASVSTDNSKPPVRINTSNKSFKVSIPSKAVTTPEVVSLLKKLMTNERCGRTKNVKINLQGHLKE